MSLPALLCRDAIPKWDPPKNRRWKGTAASYGLLGLRNLWEGPSLKTPFIQRYSVPD